MNENDDSGRSTLNSSAAAAAKRKGSFKKWLRSSHRKFTSNSTRPPVAGSFKDNNHVNSKILSSNAELMENMKIKVSFK